MDEPTPTLDYAKPDPPRRARPLTAFLLCAILFPVLAILIYAVLSYFHVLPDLRYDTEEGERELIGVGGFTAGGVIAGYILAMMRAAKLRGD